MNSKEGTILELSPCHKCGHTYLKAEGMKRCPQCENELLEKIHQAWFKEKEEHMETIDPKKDNHRREIWELDLKERLNRMLKRIPATIAMNNDLVMSASYMPIDQREDFIDYLKLLLIRLDEHKLWWEKVYMELIKPPAISLSTNSTNKELE